MTHRETFIKMCHSIYDTIHGKEKIKKIFHPINEDQLNIIIKIYNNQFYNRINLIEQYIETIPGIDNRVDITDKSTMHVGSFYLNALQHYTSGDY